MNEVEKMYSNCNIKKIRYCEVEDECPFMFGHRCEDCDMKPKPEYYIYPPFTAEKQIKIIEWLGNSKAFFDANETISSLITNHKDKNGVVKCYEGKGNSVDSCLASLINNLWQSLTEEERKQIKEILE